MLDCSYISKIEAYHDGELSAGESAAFERHLSTCPVCATELAQLRDMSGLLAAERPHDILPIELARIHRRLDQLRDRSFLRFCGAMSAVAASILIICSVWLLDGPRPNPIIRGNSQAEQSWEPIASGRLQPPQSNENGLAVKQTTDWMVVGMGGK